MSSFWRNFNHWLHWKLSFWQLPVQPVMKISSKWRHFRFSVPTPNPTPQNGFIHIQCLKHQPFVKYISSKHFYQSSAWINITDITIDWERDEMVTIRQTFWKNIFLMKMFEFRVKVQFRGPELFNKKEGTISRRIVPTWNLYAFINKLAIRLWMDGLNLNVILILLPIWFCHMAAIASKFIKIHWNLLLRVQLMILQFWFRYWLDDKPVYLKQWWLNHRRIYTSPGLNELRKLALNVKHRNMSGCIYRVTNILTSSNNFQKKWSNSIPSLTW